jgi:hypothetical protein
VEKTSRLRLRDPVASGVKCGPHGGMNSKMKSWMISLGCFRDLSIGDLMGEICGNPSWFFGL